MIQSCESLTTFMSEGLRQACIFVAMRRGPDLAVDPGCARRAAFYRRGAAL